MKHNFGLLQNLSQTFSCVITSLFVVLDLKKDKRLHILMITHCFLSMNCAFLVFVLTVQMATFLKQF